MTYPIIALSGPRACGKSTIAEHLVNLHGYTRVAFADCLRKIAALAGEERINDRLYLAELGSELRSLLPDFLLQVVGRRIESIDGPVVIEDVRFPSEVEFSRSIGALTIRLEIPVQTQLERLSKRDGKTGNEAIMLIECMDEHALPVATEWNQIIPAVGDFQELATELHQLALENSAFNAKEVYF